MKQHIYYLLAAVLALSLPFGLHGQNCNGRAAAVLDGNKVKAQLYNSADKFWDLVGNPSYEVPAGSGKHAAFAGALWIGGLDQSNQLHLSAQTYRQQGVDFGPGPVRTTGNYDCAQGFATPSPLLDDVVLGLSNNDAIAFLGTGYTVYSATSGNTQTYPFLNNRFQYTAFELNNGKVMVVGEKASVSSPTPGLPVEFIDINNYTMSQGDTLHFWHGKSSITPLDQDNLLIAGWQGAEVYNIPSGTSSTFTSMNTPRHYHPAALIGTSRVLIGPGSGHLNGITNPVNSYEIYDNGTWTAGPSSTINRGKYTRFTPLANGNILVTGGGSDVVEVYDVTSNTLSPVFNFPYSLEVHGIQPVGIDSFAVWSADAFANTTSFENIDNFIYDFQAQSVSYGPTRGYVGLGATLANGNLLVGVSNSEFIQMAPKSLSVAGARWEKVWKVSKSDIDMFLTDFANNQVDYSKYPNIRDWPAHGDVSKGEDAILAPFIDVDGDFIYTPDSGDYPCIKGDQALWWVYNDDLNANTESGGLPLGVQVEVMAYAIDCQLSPCPDTALDYVTFYEYEVTNKSNQTYIDTYIGNWLDVDIGGFADDYVGCDSTRNLAFGYNGNAVDGTAAGYGANPPALGSVILESPDNIGMTNFMYYENDFSIRGNPEMPIHYYSYMQSKWKDGNPATVGSNGYNGTVPTNYMYSGDPGSCGGPSEGWSEVSAGNQPFDRRYLQSVGPFTMMPGEIIQISIGQIYARGFYNDNLGSLCELKRVTDTLSNWYSTQEDCYDDFVLSAPEAIEPLSAALYPNPNQGTFRVELADVISSQGQLQIIDLLGRTHHMQSVDAGSKVISVQTDLAQGMYIVQIQAEGRKFSQKFQVH